MAVRLSALLPGPALPPERSSGTHLYQELSKPQGIVQLEGLGKSRKIKYLIGLRYRDLPACSIAPQPSTPLYFHFYTMSKLQRYALRKFIKMYLFVLFIHKLEESDDDYY
jgi:hypothetical protein